MNWKSKLLCGLAAIFTIALAAQAQVPGVNSTLQSVFTLAYDNSTMKPTYSATKVVTTVPASPTDVCTLNGSATKNIRVRRVLVSGLGPAVIAEPVAVLRRSAVNSGGAGGVITPAVYDTTNSLSGSTSNAATAYAEFYTTVPTTLGTFVSTLADVYLAFGNRTTGLGAGVTFTFGALGSPVVLRGVAQTLAVSLLGNSVSTVSGQTADLSCTFEWTEE